MESLRVMDAGIAPCSDGSMQLVDNLLENENMGDELLEDLDSYLEDINDRLTISRMVSDSVIRGMVNAVKEDADEKIAQKELEVAGLKDMLHLYHMDADKNEFLGSSSSCHESKITSHCRMYCNFSDVFVENDNMRKSLGSLRNAAKDQFKMLKKEIDRLRGVSSIRKISSGSELLGLGGILQDKVSERWTDVDIMLENLKATTDTVYKWMEDTLQLSKASHCRWQLEQEFQADIEGMVIKNCIRSLKEEFEERLWDQNARFCGNESVNWHEKIEEISSLRQELDAISKSLSVYEFGQLTSLGSLEIGDDWSNDKRADHFHRKVLSKQVSSSLVWEENGKHEDANGNISENSDPAYLMHMERDQLITQMTTMRRNHEQKVQEMTELNFSLKRELLKLREKGSSLPLKKDKEFDMLKKKIPHFISKLDDFLVENQKLPAFNENAENLGSLKERMESLLSENRQLKDSLSDKKKEVNRLSSHVSDAEYKMSQQHLIEANLLDGHIKDSISEEVYKCVLRELLCQIKCSTEESDLQCNMMQEIFKLVFKEAVHISEPAGKNEIEDSDMESIIMQALGGIIFREVLKDAEEKFSNLNMKYITENKLRVSLEAEALKKEEESRLVVLEMERLKQEKEQFELAFKEQWILFSKRSKESNVKLNQKLDAVTQEKQKALSLFKVKEREHQKQMEAIANLVQGFLKSVAGFENRATENISNTSLRLERLISESRLLIPNANVLRRTGLLYKQRLERRCSDLEKAEAEVDLLGDEVGTLLSLLEKIYIALDHYSPILQHYPGVSFFFSYYYF
ncbi:WPP domain-associated protein-like isoform X1 [Corylus avellana]|uniref:WPP domain-associated protein-like isoform X1 n=1 Tax=Corylus avellana TaxID=13451 RepID=UPI00286C9D94|nr:WPP domain-associated protein-like isoform X1 [Corylus avellana]